MKITLFYIPTGSAEEAKSLGRQAVEQHLAACAHVFPIQSFYFWNEHLQDDQEFILLLKTHPKLNEALQSFIEERHSYDVPCLMHWETEVNEAYGEWVMRTLQLK